MWENLYFLIREEVQADTTTATVFKRIVFTLHY